jgi:Zn-dependent peptidase ImmA (M78 family)
MPKAKQVPINPEVLKWAIKESGYSEKELVDKLQITQELFSTWIHGTKKPSITEFKKLSSALKRPTATFFLPSPPESILPKVDYRHSIKEVREKPNPQEILKLREVVRIQKILSWIQLELGKEKIKLEKVNISEAPDIVASKIRNELGLNITIAIDAKNSSQAYQHWRNSLYENGIFVFQVQMGTRSSRGFSIWDDYAPIIAVNTAWNTEAKIFTVFHELGHLLTRKNSICVNLSQQTLSKKDDPEEKWCEYFAAAILLPWDEVKSHLSKKFNRKNESKIEDIEIVRSISTHFKVSMRAAALNLIVHDVADWKLYAEIPKGSDDKKPGRGPKWIRHERKLSSYGDNTVRLFLKAVNDDLITWSDALSYLDTTDSELSET